mmetsp:Transcript_23018/g.32166  ORF Transcript_23018/g.32166 Transcript_23018/m.32166 type:complete len:933 (+) Transcript_23018:17-2815(+)|eukprot:CAMPEP_0184484266 /NCGR_PEP_ID=MMETSP0113_2-20130426/5992_1 /TAXON_ID=91329 /ORGANISM="Norrisiella sphaerica, Strain BC52" /LENGTH=932 /DNA_ID=CAMNT_0026865187 /DNA_START=248 /DNA_END=3046 /DNA_ORIENTATION=+
MAGRDDDKLEAERKRRVFKDLDLLSQALICTMYSVELACVGLRGFLVLADQQRARLTSSATKWIAGTRDEKEEASETSEGPKEPSPQKRGVLRRDLNWLSWVLIQILEIVMYVRSGLKFIITTISFPRVISNDQEDAVGSDHVRETELISDEKSGALVGTFAKEAELSGEDTKHGPVIDEKGYLFKPMASPSPIRAMGNLSRKHGKTPKSAPAPTGRPPAHREPLSAKRGQVNPTRIPQSELTKSVTISRNRGSTSLRLLKLREDIQRKLFLDNSEVESDIMSAGTRSRTVSRASVHSSGHNFSGSVTDFLSNMDWEKGELKEDLPTMSPLSSRQPSLSSPNVDLKRYKAARRGLFRLNSVDSDEDGGKGENEIIIPGSNGELDSEDSDNSSEERGHVLANINEALDTPEQRRLSLFSKIEDERERAEQEATVEKVREITELFDQANLEGPIGEESARDTPHCLQPLETKLEERYAKYEAFVQSKDMEAKEEFERSSERFNNILRKSVEELKKKLMEEAERKKREKRAIEERKRLQEERERRDQEEKLKLQREEEVKRKQDEDAKVAEDGGQELATQYGLKKRREMLTRMEKLKARHVAFEQKCKAKQLPGCIDSCRKNHQSLQLRCIQRMIGRAFQMLTGDVEVIGDAAALIMKTMSDVINIAERESKESGTIAKVYLAFQLAKQFAEFHLDDDFPKPWENLCQKAALLSSLRSPRFGKLGEVIEKALLAVLVSETAYAVPLFDNDVSSYSAERIKAHVQRDIDKGLKFMFALMQVPLALERQVARVMSQKMGVEITPREERMFEGAVGAWQWISSFLNILATNKPHPLSTVLLKAVLECLGRFMVQEYGEQWLKIQKLISSQPMKDKLEHTMQTAVATLKSEEVKRDVLQALGRPENDFSIFKDLRINFEHGKFRANPNAVRRFDILGKD